MNALRVIKGGLAVLGVLTVMHVVAGIIPLLLFRSFTSLGWTESVVYALIGGHIIFQILDVARGSRRKKGS